MQRGMLRGMAAFRWGSVLIGAAVAMERNDVTPVEAGKRVVDVLSTNFG